MDRIRLWCFDHKGITMAAVYTSLALIWTGLVLGFLWLLHHLPIGV